MLEQSTQSGVSIIIPTYERRDLLRLTLESISRSRCGSTPFEVVVADDGSSDHSIDVVAEYADRMPVRYCWQHDRGYRAAAARNMGVALARYPVLLFLDCGVLLHPAAIEAHCKWHRRAGTPSILLGYNHGFSNDNRDIPANLYSDAMAVLYEGRFERSFFVESPDEREIFYAKYGDDLGQWPAPWIVAWTCHLSVLKESLSLWGGFDENFQSWGGEDIELCIRLHKQGIGIAMDRAIRSYDFPHAKTGFATMDAATAKATLRAKQLYTLEKHDLPAVRAWLDHPYLGLNEALLESGHA